MSERGLTQARVTGAAWRDKLSVRATVSGDLRRHRETAAGFAETYGPLPPLRLDADFNEYAYESVLRVARPDLREPDAIRAWLATQAQPRVAFRAAFEHAVRQWIACPSGDAQRSGYPESFTAFQRRTRSALERLRLAAGQEGSTIVFTSGGVISAITQQVLSLPDSRFFDLSMEQINAGVTRLRPVEEGRWRLVSFNGHLHLLGHEPTLLTHL